MSTALPIIPFKYKPVNVLDDRLLDICQWSRIVANVVQWLSYFALIYVIVKRSPQMMGAYKWYIIWNVSHGMLLGTYVVLIQPYPLSPYTIIVLYGAPRLFELPEEATHYCMHVGLLIFSGTIYTTVILFVFRWAQTTQSRFVPLMSNMKFYTFAYFLYLLCILLGGVLPMHSQALSADQIRRGIKDVDPKVYALLMREKFIFGFNTDDGNEHYLLGVISICLVGVLFFVFLAYCTTSTYLYIIRNKQQLHTNTARLYMKLLNLLLMDVGIAVVMFFVPGLLFIVAQALQLQCLTAISSLGMIVVVLYPLANNLLILLYIRPYRHEFLYLMQAILFILSGKKCGKMPASKRMSLFSQSYA